jgi:hypothetical protein
VTGSPRDPGRREPTIAELTELSRYAAERVTLYRRKLFAGGGEPRRLAELERVAAGAVKRLRGAIQRAKTPEETP